MRNMAYCMMQNIENDLDQALEIVAEGYKVEGEELKYFEDIIEHVLNIADELNIDIEKKLEER